MEFFTTNLLYSMTLTLPFLALSLILYITFIIKSSEPESDKKTLKKTLPPGSFGWPIIGETLAFVKQDHNKFIGERMRKYSPKIFKTKILGEKTAVLCGPLGHKFVAANEEKLFLSWRPQSMQRLFRSSYQKSASAVIPRQAEVQIVKAPGFLRPESLFKYVETMDSLVSQHFDSHWKGKEVVEVHQLAQLLVLSLAGRFFWGLEDPTRIQRLSKLMDTMMFALHVVPVDFPGTVFYKAMRAAEEVREDLVRLVQEKKEAMASGAKMSDLLAFMIANPDPTGRFMPENEVADKVMGMVAAAFNSPAMTTAFILKFLGQSLEVYHKVRNEQMEIANSKKPGEALNWEDITQRMKYSWNVALEVMRLIPPLQGTFREAATDITYDGYTIPKGWKVYWTVSTTNMNPEYFSNPEEFDPTRYERSGLPAYSNIPFGSGPRICPGKDYARLQILIFMHHLVRKFKWELINPNCNVLGGMNPIPIQGLHVRLHPYN